MRRHCAFEPFVLNRHLFLRIPAPLVDLLSDARARPGQRPKLDCTVAWRAMSATAVRAQRAQGGVKPFVDTRVMPGKTIQE